MSSTPLATRSASAVSAWHEPQTIEQAHRFACAVVSSGLAPAGVDTPEKALIAMAMGAELGMSPMRALRSIHVIKGKPTLSANAMVGLVLASPVCERWTVTHTDAERCTIVTKRCGASEQSLTWTIEQAKRAGLLGNAMWGKYPEAMLRARCESALARLAYPDVIGGWYTPEEMGAPVSVDGEVLDATVEPSTPSEPQRPAPARRAIAQTDPVIEVAKAAAQTLARVKTIDLDAAKRQLWAEAKRWASVRCEDGERPRPTVDDVRDALEALSAPPPADDVLEVPATEAPGDAEVAR